MGNPEDPYAYVPTSLPGSVARKRRRENWSTGKKLAVWGAWLQLGLPLCFLAFALVLAQFPISLDAGDPPPPKLPPLVAWLSSVAWLPCVGGILMALAGYILLLVALMAKRYRAKWFFWFLMVYGGLLTACFPLIPLGAVFVIYCLVRRTDFFRRHKYKRSAY